MRAAFTGHRPTKIAGFAVAPEATETAIRKALRDEIVRQTAMGVERFLCGMAPGIDLWAADEVLRLRDEGSIPPTVELVAAIPYPDFVKRFSKSDAALYRKVLAAADRTVFVSERYAHECYERRNDFLVDNADLVIAYYEGTAGGTRYTVERARRKGLPVINLFGGELFQ